MKIVNVIFLIAFISTVFSGCFSLNGNLGKNDDLAAWQMHQRTHDQAHQDAMRMHDQGHLDAMRMHDQAHLDAMRMHDQVHQQPMIFIPPPPPPFM